MMTGCDIPVADVVHVELGCERVRPDPATSSPRPATVVHVCALDHTGLAIVGVASGSRQLHSLTIEESEGTIWVGALVGDRSSEPGREVRNHFTGQFLWVSEFPLHRPLGSRTVRDLFGDQRTGAVSPMGTPARVQRQEHQTGTSDPELTGITSDIRRSTDLQYPRTKEST